MGGDDSKPRKGGTTRMAQERCRMCGRLDDMKNMENPCDCYKKFDALLVHRKCLQVGLRNRL